MKKLSITAIVVAISATFAMGQTLTPIDKSNLISQLKKCIENDQKYRAFISYGTLDLKSVDSIKNLSDDAMWNFLATNKKKLDKDVSDSLWVLQNKIDLENIIILENIVKKYGWPSDERLGEKASAEILLFHTPTAKLEALELLLLTEVKEKRMDPLKFGLFVDNMRLKHGKDQVYATNMVFSKEFQKPLPPMIEDLEATNKARREIGLEPLKEGEYRIKE